MRKLKAIQEAASVVMSYISRYHFLSGEFISTSELIGDVCTIPCIKKFYEEGLPYVQTSVSMPEVVVDGIIILYAPIEAGRIYCEQNNLFFVEGNSDYIHNKVEQLLASATPQFEADITGLIAACRNIALANWEQITTISNHLLQNNDLMTTMDAVNELDTLYGRNTWI